MPVDPRRSLAPAWLPAFNKAVGNRVQGLWAPRLAPWAVVVHTGRRSGKTYKTPVMAWIQDGRLAIALVYGSDAQWVKNIMAAGGGTIVRRGRELPVRNPRIVTADDGEPLPRIPARLSRRMGVLVLDLA